MKKNYVILFLGGLLICASLKAQQKKSASNNGFIENKGQVSDQSGAARPDILFSCNAGNLVYHLSDHGISYQLSKVERWKKEEEHNTGFTISGKEKLIPEETKVYRLDLQWLNSKPSPRIERQEALPGFTNYYLAVCPQGAMNVRTYKGVIYKDLYENIDLHYYLKDNNLKYDYLVAAGADYTKIKIKVNGALDINSENDGSIAIITPLGTVKEGAPVVFQNKKRLDAKWVVNGNTLSFLIGNYNPELPLLIDPVVRMWGTYYGGPGVDESKNCSTDINGNVYLAGKSNSTAGIATTGGFMTTLTGTNNDAYLVKFNNAGVRQWATYYGGVGDDFAYACTADPSLNVYLTGQAGIGSNGLGTTGAQQQFHGGDKDAFLVKFNSSGARIWGTYYASTGADLGEALVVDPSTSDVYMSGYNSGATNSSVFVTTGAHQTSFGSIMLVKFNSAGVRQWGTFYGNSSWSHGLALAIDGSANIYMAGNTDATGGIATPGAHQTTMQGMFDAYLVKFNSAGIRQWGTYYGDVSMETVGGIATDASGNVYLGGLTGSPTSISTPGSHQPVHGAAYNGDGMLVKFNSSGVRQWGTYYGGTTDDYISSCIVAPNGDLYVSGYSQSPSAGTVIATSNGLQPVNAGYGDGFLAHFTTAGVRVAATYYGESGVDIAHSCAADPYNNIYLCGVAQTGPGNNFPTSGSHQSVFGGGTSDAFLVQFKECSAPASPVNVTAAGNLTLCNGGTTTLNATSTGTINWYNVSTGGLSLGTGTTFISQNLTAGTHTFYAEATDLCTTNPVRTAITITVVAPAVQINSSAPGICLGETATLTANGAAQYTWSTNSNATSFTVAPSTNTTYTLTGLSADGCTASVTFTLLTYAIPTITINTGNSIFCAGKQVTLTASGASQYTWSSGPTNSVISFVPQNNATYTVTGASAEGCKSTASILIQTINCTGLAELEKELLFIYPNPFSHLITVQAQSRYKIAITNSLGQEIYLQEIEPGKTTIDLTLYPNGIYFIKIMRNQQVSVVKFVKE